MTETQGQSTMLFGSYADSLQFLIEVVYVWHSDCQWGVDDNNGIRSSI